MLVPDVYFAEAATGTESVSSITTSTIGTEGAPPVTPAPVPADVPPVTTSPAPTEVAPTPPVTPAPVPADAPPVTTSPALTEVASTPPITPAPVPAFSPTNSLNVSPIQLPSEAELAAKKAKDEADAKVKAENDEKVKADAEAFKKVQKDADLAKVDADVATKALNEANIALAKAQSMQDLLNVQITAIAKSQVDAAKALSDAKSVAVAAKSKADLAIKTYTDAGNFVQVVMPTYQIKENALAADKYCQAKSPCPSACMLFSGKCRVVCSKITQQDICSALGGFGGACSWSNNLCINS